MADYPMSLRLCRIGKDSLGVVFPKYILEAEKLQSGCIVQVTLSAQKMEVRG
jgi:hypothetical protein